MSSVATIPRSTARGGNPTFNTSHGASFSPEVMAALKKRVADSHPERRTAPVSTIAADQFTSLLESVEGEIISPAAESLGAKPEEKSSFPPTTDASSSFLTKSSNLTSAAAAAENAKALAAQLKVRAEDNKKSKANLATFEKCLAAKKETNAPSVTSSLHSLDLASNEPSYILTEDKMREMNSVFRALQRQVKDLQSTNSDMSSAHAKEKANWMKRSEVQESEYGHLLKENEGLKSQLSEMETQMSTMQTEFGKMKDQIQSELKRMQGDFKKQLDGMRNQFSSAQPDKSTVNKAITTSPRRSSTLMTRAELSQKNKAPSKFFSAPPRSILVSFSVPPRSQLSRSPFHGPSIFSHIPQSAFGNSIRAFDDSYTLVPIVLQSGLQQALRSGRQPGNNFTSASLSNGTGSGYGTYQRGSNSQAVTQSYFLRF